MTLAVPAAEQFVGLVRKGALDTDDGWQLGLAKFSPHRCESWLGSPGTPHRVNELPSSVNSVEAELSVPTSWQLEESQLVEPGERTSTSIVIVTNRNVPESVATCPGSGVMLKSGTGAGSVSAWAFDVLARRVGGLQRGLEIELAIAREEVGLIGFEIARRLRPDLDEVEPGESGRARHVDGLVVDEVTGGMRVEHPERCRAEGDVCGQRCIGPTRARHRPPGIRDNRVSAGVDATHRRVLGLASNRNVARRRASRRKW